MVSASAGNRGESLHNGIPWVLTVAASTIDRFFSGILTLRNGQIIIGWTMFPSNIDLQSFKLVYNKTLSACNPSMMSMDKPHSSLIIYVMT